MNLFWWLKPLTFNRKYAVSTKTVDEIKKGWFHVTSALETKSPAQLKQALIVADKSLDNALRDIAKGETMGERLKNSKDRFDRDTYDKIWRAHKVRNSMVHETSFDPSYYVLVESIGDLKRGLVSLGVKL